MISTGWIINTTNGCRNYCGLSRNLVILQASAIEHKTILRKPIDIQVTKEEDIITFICHYIEIFTYSIQILHISAAYDNQLE